MHILRIHVLVQIEYMEHVSGIAGCGYVLHDFSVYRPYFSKINADKIMNHDKKCRFLYDKSPSFHDITSIPDFVEKPQIALLGSFPNDPKIWGLSVNDPKNWGLWNTRAPEANSLRPPTTFKRLQSDTKPTSPPQKKTRGPGGRNLSLVGGFNPFEKY